MTVDRLPPLNHGDRVFVHDPEPPYRLWSGVIAYSDQLKGPDPVWHIAVDVPGLRRRSYPSHDEVHPEPYQPLAWCERCVALLAPLPVADESREPERIDGLAGVPGVAVLG
ncbi:MAG: hypothetical protein EXR51_09340 [Dehalococcoidia bacterium]|nr:hypothetical protein [Dehalococcoidia bacterium]